MTTSDHQEHLHPSNRSCAPILELRHVTKDYGGVRAVSGISLQLAQGEFLTLLGPSGCGKTTLMNMVAGFFPPTSGDILIAGANVTALKPHRRDIGMVFQNYALFPHMNVAQNIAFGLEERRVPRAQIRSRVDGALAMVKLTGFGERRIPQLSGGQQQRVALARALVIRPQVLLLDEPLSALDKNLRTQMQIEIKQIQKQANVAAVFVTHDQSEALSLSDRIAVMSHGRVEQVGTPQEIYAVPGSPFVASFVGDVNRVPARVMDVTPERLVLEGPGVCRFIVPGTPHRAVGPGASVEMFVRPEDIEVTAEGDGANTLAAIVSAYSYQGSFTHLIAQPENTDPLIIKVPGGAVIAQYPVGSPIGLRLNLSRATIHPA